MIADGFNAKASDTAIAEAAQKHDFDGITAMLAAGANADADIPGHGPLIVWAVKQGNAGLVEAIAGAGAKINAADAQGGTALIWAAGHGLCEIAGNLLARGADPLLRNAAGLDALEVAHAAAKELGAEFNNDPNMQVGDLENSIARLGRVATLLKEAQEETRRARNVESCHGGLEDTITVSRPLKFRVPDAAA
jgi:ankyrin repeat protein